MCIIESVPTPHYWIVEVVKPGVRAFKVAPTREFEWAYKQH